MLGAERQLTVSKQQKDRNLQAVSHLILRCAHYPALGSLRDRHPLSPTAGSEDRTVCKGQLTARLTVLSERWLLSLLRSQFSFQLTPPARQQMTDGPVIVHVNDHAEFLAPGFNWGVGKWVESISPLLAFSHLLLIVIAP